MPLDNNFDSKDDTRNNFLSAIECIIDLMIVSEEQNSSKKNGELNQVNTGYFKTEFMSYVQNMLSLQLLIY